MPAAASAVLTAAVSPTAARTDSDVERDQGSHVLVGQAGPVGVLARQDEAGRQPGLVALAVHCSVPETSASSPASSSRSTGRTVWFAAT